MDKIPVSHSGEFYLQTRKVKSHYESKYYSSGLLPGVISWPICSPLDKVQWSILRLHMQWETEIHIVQLIPTIQESTLLVAFKKEQPKKREKKHQKCSLSKSEQVKRYFWDNTSTWQFFETAEKMTALRCTLFFCLSFLIRLKIKHQRLLGVSASV